MENRYFVIKGMKLGSGDLKAGSYLSEENAEELGEKGLSRLIRLALLIDVTGSMTLPRLDNDKRRKRIRYLSAIGTEESQKVLEILESQDARVRLVYNNRAAERSALRKRVAQGLPPEEEVEEELDAEEEPEAEVEPEVAFKPLAPEEVLSDPKPKHKPNNRGRKRGR